MTVRATYSPEVAWSEDLTGVFSIGLSDLAGDDTIAGSYGHNAYDTLSNWKTISIRRGRSSDFGAMEQGIGRTALRDTDGTYNPENAASSLAGVLDVLRPFRVLGAAGWMHDAFCRPDAATLGTSPTGHAWTELAGTWGISDGAAYCSAGSTVFDLAVVDSGLADGTVACTITTPASGTFACSVVFRAQDAAYHWRAKLVRIGATQQMILRLVQAGSSSDVASAAYTFEYSTAYQIEVRLSGSSIGAYVNGALVVSATDSRFADQTRHGIGVNKDYQPTIPRFTAFRASSEYQYPLYAGYISNIDHDPTEHESEIAATDLFEWLVRSTKPVIAEVTNYRVDEIIGLILDAVVWTDPAMRDLEASRDTVPAWEATGSADALSLIRTLLETDLGWFFIDASGRAVYRNRDVWYQHGVPVVLSRVRRGGLRVGISKEGVINSQTVTGADSVAQTATDATSQRRRGLREGAVITSANVADQYQALALARFLVSLKATPRPPARSAGLINRDAADLTNLLSLEIGDLVTLTEAAGGTDLTGRVQAITHDVSPGGLHEATYTIQECLGSLFQIGISELGGSAVIGF